MQKRKLSSGDRGKAPCTIGDYRNPILTPKELDRTLSFVSYPEENRPWFDVAPTEQEGLILLLTNVLKSFKGYKGKNVNWDRNTPINEILEYIVNEITAIFPCEPFDKEWGISRNGRGNLTGIYVKEYGYHSIDENDVHYLPLDTLIHIHHYDKKTYEVIERIINFLHNHSQIHYWFDDYRWIEGYIESEVPYDKDRYNSLVEDGNKITDEDVEIYDEIEKMVINFIHSKKSGLFSFVRDRVSMDWGDMKRYRKDTFKEVKKLRKNINPIFNNLVDKFLSLSESCLGEYDDAMDDVSQQEMFVCTSDLFVFLPTSLDYHKKRYYLPLEQTNECGAEIYPCKNYFPADFKQKVKPEFKYDTFGTELAAFCKEYVKAMDEYKAAHNSTFLHPDKSIQYSLFENETQPAKAS